MNQPKETSMDAMTGVAARDAALDLVEAAAPDWWLTLARLRVATLAGRRVPFTMDDVWRGLDHPPEPRALGAVINAAARAGTIRKTGQYQPSTRPEAHARPIPVWVGVPQAAVDSVDERLF